MILFIKVLKLSNINRLLNATTPVTGVTNIQQQRKPNICTPSQVIFLIKIG